MRCIIVSCLFVTVLQTILLGGETEIEVLQGKVQGRTPKTEMVISAGQKGLLREGQEPIVAVNDPLVREIIYLYRWVEEERKSGGFDGNTSIWVNALDDEQVERGAFLGEYLNDGSEAKSVIPGGGLLPHLKDFRIYDFEGNLLDYEVKQNSERKETYWIHLHNPIQPGETIRTITVSSSSKRVGWMSEGPFWSFAAALSDSQPHLYLAKIILPKSAILLETYPKVLLTDKVEDRIALTFRIFTEDNITRDARFAVSFLWPDKDGTSLESIPPEMRGLEDPEQARLIQETHKQIARIMDGQRFTDHSTPMNCMLSGVSSLFHDLDKLEMNDASDPFIKKVFGGNLGLAKEILPRLKKELIHLDVHSCSVLPADLKQGDIAWIKLKHKGTFQSITTIEYVYVGESQWMFRTADFINLINPPRPSE